MGIYLAWQLKKKKETKILNKIKDGKKENIHQMGIKRIFKQFYAQLIQKQEIRQKLKNIWTYVIYQKSKI